MTLKIETYFDGSGTKIRLIGRMQAVFGGVREADQVEEGVQWLTW